MEFGGRMKGIIERIGKAIDPFGGRTKILWIVLAKDDWNELLEKFHSKDLKINLQYKGNEGGSTVLYFCGIKVSEGPKSFVEGRMKVKIELEEEKKVKDGDTDLDEWDNYGVG